MKNTLRNFMLFAMAAVLFADHMIEAASAQSFVTDERLVVGTESNKSASIRIGDLDADGDPDIVVANGRHWPQPNYVFFNQGRGRFNVMRPVGRDRSTSYACELADLDGDGDLDIAVGNDMAPNQIFLNDGEGQFSLKGTFGKISSVRSLTVNDIDDDGDSDILIACRNRTNMICLNDGNASFDVIKEFGTSKDATIGVAVGDVDSDGDKDLLLANRDAKPSEWLLNAGGLNFDESKKFEKSPKQSRVAVVGDFDRDGKIDWAMGNIGQPNQLFLGDGAGGVKTIVTLGDKEGRTYCLTAADMDLDGDLDLVAGNIGKPNSVFLNNGDATDLKELSFGASDEISYGLDVGDLNGDGRPDIVVAWSDGPTNIWINRLGAVRKNVDRQKQSENRNPDTKELKPQTVPVKTAAQKKEVADTAATDWSAFRGNEGQGVADGFALPTEWNADAEAGPLKNVLWQSDVPGLGHSSPVIAGDKLFLLTAVAIEGVAPLKVESGGKIKAADDNGVQQWLLLCYDKNSGEKLWENKLHEGKPRATRHAKATHANTSVSVQGDKIVAFLGSEGLYCLDLSGNLLWKQDLGVIDVSKYDIGWGFASSPTVHQDRIVIVCDAPDDPYLAIRRLSDGEEVWRKSRLEICERSWGTPLVHEHDGVVQIVVNGWPWIVSYDLADGSEIWRVKGGGDNAVPTPFVADEKIFITNAHGGPAPIYAIDPSAKGDISDVLAKITKGNNPENSPVVWYTGKGGSYMSTPVVYRDQIYLGSTRGIIRSLNATSGEKVFEGRLGSKSGVTASLVAGDGKVFCATENGTVYVLAAGDKLKVVAKNKVGAPCLASPAISAGTIFIRTTKKLIAVGEVK